MAASICTTGGGRRARHWWSPETAGNRGCAQPECALGAYGNVLHESRACRLSGNRASRQQTGDADGPGSSGRKPEHGGDA
jgi:hypothetical protein